MRNFYFLLFTIIMSYATSTKLYASTYSTTRTQLRTDLSPNANLDFFKTVSLISHMVYEKPEKIKKFYKKTFNIYAIPYDRKKHARGLVISNKKLGAPIIIAIKGTSNFRNMITDLNVKKKNTAKKKIAKDAKYIPAFSDIWNLLENNWIKA